MVICVQKSQRIHLTQGKAIFVDQPDFLWSIPGLLRYDLFLCLHLVDGKDKEKNYYKLLLSSHIIGPLIVTLSLSETASVSSLIPAHAEEKACQDDDHAVDESGLKGLTVHWAMHAPSGWCVRMCVGMFVCEKLQTRQTSI